MPRSYYGKRAVGQTNTVMTRPTAGLDMYQYATTINDNNLSNALDILPDANDVLKLHQYMEDASGYFTDEADATGEVKEAVYLKYTSTDIVSFVLLVYDTLDSKYYLKLSKVNRIGTVSITDFDISSVGLDADTTRSLFFSSCVFATEAEKFAMFTCESDKKLIWFDGTEFGDVDLPFYPKKIVAHVNRVFIIDIENKLWWCRAGDFYTWYGLDEDDDYITTSTNCKNGSFTLIQDPDVPRPLLVTLTAVGDSDTYGTITIVGTDYNDVAISEVMNPVVGANVSFKSYKTIDSITQAGWTAVGTADTIKIGIAAIGTGYVQEDQGYWTIENESSLCDLCVIGRSLYIFSPKSIYIFSGYSPDTFALQVAVSDIGMSDGDDAMRRHLTVANNVAYFISNRNVYEYNGSDMPRLISHSIVTNGSVANYVYGGINEIPTVSVYALATDLDYLYVYAISATSSSVSYVFNIKSRSWWKRSTLSTTDIGTNGKMLLLPADGKTNIYEIASNVVSNTFDVYLSYRNVFSGSNYPYLITKAFSTKPSEEGTLTNLILTLRGTEDDVCTVSLYFSNSDGNTSPDADTFTLVESKSVTFTGSMERLVYNIHPSLISRDLHYRLKLVVELPDYSVKEYASVYLYNLERVHRIAGRSR